MSAYGVQWIPRERPRTDERIAVSFTEDEIAVLIDALAEVRREWLRYTINDHGTSALITRLYSARELAREDNDAG